jgi:tryptophan 7-halogenase
MTSPSQPGNWGSDSSLWGPRPYFNYNFGPVLDTRTNRKQSKPNGFYCDEDIEYTDLISALMTENRAFASSNGSLVLHDHVAYHLENARFVQCLETGAAVLGIEIVDDTVAQVVPGPRGIDRLVLKSGCVEQAGLFVDCSGFASILLGGAMKEPFISYKSSLFCERAVVGGWNRADSPDPMDQIVKPYTTSETMDAGWSWQIEHEHRINRGYVYCPGFISDEQAEAEFRAKNPRIHATRIVKFVSGRHERAWVGNVVAIGNANGFVEPLEATALEVISTQCVNLAETLANSDRCPRATQVKMYNRANEWAWEGIRAFLALHYKFNTRLKTAFWKHCREETDLASAEAVVEYYQENGPDAFWRLPLMQYPQEIVSGYFTLLIGMKVPYRRTWKASDEEMSRFNSLRMSLKETARQGFTVRQALETIRSPGWAWK